jgi:hypothetical protein
MTSNFQTFCDAVVDDLTNNVTGLRDARVHRYAPWDPEQLIADGGERHLAVFPAAEAADESIPLVTGPGGDMLIQVYRVVVWEDAGDEASRGVADEDAAADLLELLEAVRERFYKIANTFLGSTELTKYVGAALPDRAGQVRWFQVTVRARTSAVSS